MKSLLSSTLLAFSVLLASCAMAQDPQPENDQKPSVAAARCQYSQTDDNCVTSAQAPRRFPAPRRRCGACARPRPGVPYAPMPVSPSARHVVIGALVGFTVGAIVPANGSARTRLSVGLVGGLFGALIGASIPAYPSYHRQRNRWPDEDDEDDDLAQRPHSNPSPSAAQPKRIEGTLQLEKSSPSAPSPGEP